MTALPERKYVCPFRYIQRGRTFCALAIRESRYTVDEVIPATCSACAITEILAEHPCGRMALGVEIGVYSGRQTGELFYASCELTVVRLLELGGCTAEDCPYWEPLEPDKAAAIVEEARRRQGEAG